MSQIKYVLIHENSLPIDEDKIERELPKGVEVVVIDEGLPIEQILNPETLGECIYIRGHVNKKASRFYHIGYLTSPSAPDIRWVRQNCKARRIFDLKNGIDREKAMKNGADDYIDRGITLSVEEAIAEKVRPYLPPN